MNVSLLITKAIVPLVVFAAFAIARRYLPPSAVKAGEETSAVPSSRFTTYAWLFGFPAILVGVLLCWSLHFSLVAANRWYSLHNSADGIRLWPQPAIWWFLPALAAGCLANEIALQIWGAVGDRDAMESYIRWGDQKSGFHARRLLLWMGLFIALPVGIFTVLEIPVHATLRDSDIIACGYAFKGCETYQYSDARKLTLIRGFRLKDGSLQQRAGIVVDFRDGRRWNSADYGDFKRTVDSEVEDVLVKRTGLPLNQADTESDIRK